jgi:hypothetical protein
MSQPTLRFFQALAVTGFALALAQPAAAVQDSNFSFDTTADLAAVCATPDTAAEYMVAHQACRAFIKATVQYHDEISNRKKLPPLVCYPAGSTVEQGKAIFLDWAKANAGDKKLMGEQPVVGLVRSLAAKFPCKK